MGVEENESPRKDLLRLGGGGAGAFDGLLSGLVDSCTTSVVLSSDKGMDRPEFTLLIDIGLVLLEGGGAGAGFFGRYELACDSFCSADGSVRPVCWVESSPVEAGGDGRAGKALYLSPGDCGDTGGNLSSDGGLAPSRLDDDSVGSSKETVCGPLICIGLP